MLPRWLADAILFSPEGLQPFRVAGERIGWLRPDLLQLLLWRWSTVFAVREGGIVLNDRLTGARERTEAIAEVTHALRKAGWVRGWRDEHYAAIGETDGETKLTMERAAVKRFGVRARAAHLNGIVRGANGWSMWIATRSRSKQTEPGCLDNLVGGGMRAGASALDTLERESWEEAGIEAKLISQARDRKSVV